MRDLLRELRVAARTLRRTPTFAVGATMVLALGIGGGTAVFAVLDAVVLRPVPYSRPEQLVSVLAAHPRRQVQGVSMTPADYLALRQGTLAMGGSDAAAGVFAALGAYVPFGSVDMTDGDEPLQLPRMLVSDGLLEALALEPALGRRFVAEEYRAGDAKVAMVSHRLWQQRLGADRAVLARRLELDGVTYAVVGVLPRRFRLPGGDPDVLLPLTLGPEAASDRSAGYLGAIGRLREGVGVERAAAGAARVAARLVSALPADDADLAFQVMPLGELHAGPSRGALAALLAAAGLVLTIACTNVAALQLLRGLARQQEIELRRALGASRARVARTLALEVAWMVAAGGALGLGIAALGLRFVADPTGIYLPASLRPEIGGRAVLAALALSAATAALAGLLPALYNGDFGGVAAGSRSSPPRRVARLQSTLVVTEATLAFVLLTAAAMLGSAYLRLSAGGSGFRPSEVLAFDLALPASRYPQAAHVDAFQQSLRTRLLALPGVLAAGAAKEAPPAGSWSYQAAVEGSALEVNAGWGLVTPGYFEALGSSVVAGRLADGMNGAARTAVLNRTAAGRLFGNEPAVGARVRFNGDSYEVVAVVADHLVAGEPPTAMVYLPSADSTVPLPMRRSMTFVLRTDGDPTAAAAAVRGTVHALDRSLPVVDLGPLDDRLARTTAVARPQFNARLLTLLAAYGLTLLVLGVQSTLGFALRAGRRELGIRMALGERPRAAATRLLRRALLLAGGGSALGVLAANATTRMLRATVAGLEAAPPSLLAFVSSLVLAAAMLAAAGPALRAARVDPSIVLRED